MQETKVRYSLIDGIRGISIVSMVLFHFSYDVFMVYGVSPGWYGQLPVRLWQQSICWTFILVSGLVWQWSSRSRNLRRGILLNFWGLVISLVTWIAMPGEAVWFGILTFIGCAVLFCLPLERLLNRIPPVPGILACLLLFFQFQHVQNGYLGFGSLELVRLPDFLYECRLLTPAGFPFPGFASSDYFPWLPWFFLYLTGYFLGVIFRRNSVWQAAARRPLPLLSAIGRKSIWIYLLHQPICMLICMAIFH